MAWEAPEFVEVKMDAEINSYQDDFERQEDDRFWHGIGQIRSPSRGPQAVGRAVLFPASDDAGGSRPAAVLAPDRVTPTL